MQPIQIFNRLLQPCGNCKAVAAGVLSIEQIEYDLSVICACFIVALFGVTGCPVFLFFLFSAPCQDNIYKSRTVRGSDYQLYIVFLGKSNFLTVFTCKFTHCMQKSRFFRVFSLFSLEISVLLYTVFMNTPFFWFLCKKCFTSFCTHCIIHR